MRFVFLLLLVISLQVSGQAPQAINYQGILRNASGQAIPNKQVKIRVSVSTNSIVDNNSVYTEEISAKTNEFGIYNVAIGKGKATKGTFASIAWGTNKYWVLIELDENLTNKFEFAGSMELASVPYALYAEKAKSLDNPIAGPAGPQGPQGLQGIKGDKGDAGATGPAGATGATGPAGAQGPIGLTGPVGPQGQAGATGPQGPIGLTGPAGANGATGAQGLQGIKGDKGDTGAPGAQGPIGLTGPAGAIGAAGPQGPIGLTGPAGPAGTTGAQGPIGLTGPAGAAGATGAQGPIGLTGPAGSTGAQGPIGLTGPAGATGATGPAGTNGATWFTGAGTASSTLGVVNDLYLNTTSGEYYKKTNSNTWTLQANLTGPSGSSSFSNGNFDWHVPDGYVNVVPLVEYVIYPYNQYGNTNDIVSTYGQGYVVPAGKNLYLYNTKCSPFWGSTTSGVTADGIYLEQSQTNDLFYVTPTNTIGGTNASLQNIKYPMIFGPGTIISMDAGRSSGNGNNAYNFLAISGFLVDKKVNVIFSNQTYTVPANYFFYRMKPLHLNASGSTYYDFTMPLIYDSNSIIPAKTNGYLIQK